MKESILHVLMYLFENHMKDDTTTMLNEESLVNELRQAGFASEEINRAFEWLEGLAASNSSVEELNQISTNTFRVLAPEEKSRISADCWGYLNFLEQAGILNPMSREVVIDRMLQMSPDLIDVPLIKWVVLLVLFSRPDSKEELKIMEKLVLEESLGGIH